MENFIVSARKYRPKAFDEVVGQKHVTNTLDNALRQNHLAQALLFTGPRGVGKTTCARILAKMINSDDGIEEDHDFSFNIFELDAASNNSVDDIRNLIDQVRFAPQRGNYKVYIIDEVHMLSQAAFNAFLKTLEEPPKHAIFILATTEKHKIIPTILSRCQIFDFKRISVEDTTKHLEGVAQKEGVEIEADALHVIAQKADGALRDALSIFDRIVSFSGNKVTYKDVIDNLRILDYDYYFRTTDLLLQNDRAGLLLIYHEILDNGFDGHLFVNGLASHFRDLLVSKDARTLELLEVGEEAKKRYMEQSVNVSIPFLLKGLKIISECDIRYKSSNNQHLLVEFSLLQIAQLNTPQSEEKKNSDKVVKTPKETPPPPVEVVSKAPETPPAKVSDPISIEISSPAPEAPPAEVQKEEAPAPKPEPEEPQAKKPAFGSRKSSGGEFSISSVLKGEEKTTKESEGEAEEDLEEPSATGPAEAFTENALNNAWGDHMENLKKAGRQRIYSSLNNKKLTLKENFLVEIQLENEIQQSYYKEEKPGLLKFIREKLNNFSIQFETVIVHDPKKLEPYSAEEKFKYMAEKNPNLLTLKQKLDLDLE